MGHICGTQEGVSTDINNESSAVNLLHHIITVGDSQFRPVVPAAPSPLAHMATVFLLKFKPFGIFGFAISTVMEWIVALN